MAEADSVESSAAYPKYLDWLRYLSAFLLFTYASSKLLGRQFSLPPEIALRPVGSLSGYQLAWCITAIPMPMRSSGAADGPRTCLIRN